MTEKNQEFNVSASSNPLINPPVLPYGAAAFDKIKTEHFLPAIEWGIEELKKDIEAIKNNPDMPSFENTIEALEHAGEDLERIVPVFHTLANSHADDEIRALENVINDKITPVISDITMDDVLFARIKAVHESQKKGRLNLADDQKMLLENMYQSRVRSGALLSPEKKEQLKQIHNNLVQLTTKYGQNMVKATGSFERIATAEELKGLPQRTMNMYKKRADMAAHAPDVTEERKNELQGKYLIGLMPPPMDIMVYCENRVLRKEIYDVQANVCNGGEFDNRQIVMDIVKLRHDAAQLLGYQNHAEFILADRMAGSPQVVNDFLQKNLEAYKPAAEQYFNSVKEYAENTHQMTDMQPYDFAFYDTKLKQEKFSFDEEKLRPYFEFNNVFNGLKQHFEKFFKVQMVDCTDEYPAHRDDAKVYEVQDQETGKVKALFYADYFADSKAKRGGAWMNAVRTRGLDKHGTDQIPIVTNSCNFDQPSKDQPSLLSIRDIQTMFHELGHGFHGMAAESRYPSLAGTHVKWDFVELPSQLMENWAMTPEVLKTFARHYETGEVIPDEYIDKITEMKNYGAASQGLRQTNFAMMDMFWHSTEPSMIHSVAEVEDMIHQKTSFWPERTLTMSTHFGHLFGDSVGYSAGYYSYKWAEVLDADAFSLFEGKDLYDAEAIKRVKDTIYAQGGNVPPMELFKQMMGRDPDPDAMFRREGVLPEKDQAVSAPAPKPRRPSLS